MSDGPGPETTIFLIRHGDRYDYANKEEWDARAKQLGFERHDPPLSALGHAQSRELASQILKLTAGTIDACLVSPYLRVIQTAVPFAHLTGLPINVEEGLSEVSHAPGTIPSAEQRYPMFPEVSVSYTSAVPVIPTAKDRHTGAPCELYPLDYFRRTLRLGEHLQRQYAGKTVVLFSHAASVALVALLAQQSLRDVGKFAPCGIFKLVGRPGGGPWRIELHGGENASHITTNSLTTYAWGFAESRWPAEEHWATVLGEVERAKTGAKTQ